MLLGSLLESLKNCGSNKKKAHPTGNGFFLQLVVLKSVLLKTGPEGTKLDQNCVENLRMQARPS